EVEDLEEDVVIEEDIIDRGQGGSGVAHLEDVPKIVGLVVRPDAGETAAGRRRERIGLRARIAAADSEQVAVPAGGVLGVVTVAGYAREGDAVDRDRRSLADLGRSLRVGAVE